MKKQLFFFVIFFILISYQVFLLNSESNKLRNNSIDLSTIYNFIDWLICVPTLLFCCLGFYFIFKRIKSLKVTYNLLEKDLIKKYNKSKTTSFFTIYSVLVVFFSVRIVYVIFHVSLSTKMLTLSTEDSLKYLFLGF
jgi:hypothetical protein